MNLINVVVETLKSGKRFYIRKKPRIFMFGGITLSAAGTVAACAATYNHIDRILDHHQSNMEAADELPEKEAGKEKLKVIAETTMEIGKVYALPVVMSAAGYASIIYANHLQEKRQAILSDALSTLGAAYAAYRKRVEEKYGKDAEEAILTDSSVTKLITDDGKTVKTEEITTCETAGLIESQFDKFFDPSSKNWEDDAETNYSFLWLAQQECNHILRTEGYLSLKDVYEKLDIPVTKASLAAGWVYNPKGEGADDIPTYVDFGLGDPHDLYKRRFVNGYENCVLLHFNCAANIGDYI